MAFVASEPATGPGWPNTNDWLGPVQAIAWRAGAENAAGWSVGGHQGEANAGQKLSRPRAVEVWPTGLDVRPGGKDKRSEKADAHAGKWRLRKTVTVVLPGPNAVGAGHGFEGADVALAIGQANVGRDCRPGSFSRCCRGRLRPGQQLRGSHEVGVRRSKRTDK